MLTILDTQVVKMDMEMEMDTEIDVRISMSLRSRRHGDEVGGGDRNGASK